MICFIYEHPILERDSTNKTSLLGGLSASFMPSQAPYLGASASTLSKLAAIEDLPCDISSNVNEQWVLVEACFAHLSPLWASHMIEDLRIEDILSNWASKEGPHYSHGLWEKTLLRELQHAKYTLIARAMANKEPTHLGKLLSRCSSQK